jgi:hypothetical protein
LFKIETLEDSSSKGFLNVLDGSGVGNVGITISSGLGTFGGDVGVVMWDISWLILEAWGIGWFSVDNKFIMLSLDIN